MSLLECNLEAALALPGAQWTGLGLVAALLRCCVAAPRPVCFVRASLSLYARIQRHRFSHGAVLISGSLRS